MEGNNEQYSVKIERYNSDNEYDISMFDCGEVPFNEYLEDGKISRELERKISIPYVCLAIKDNEKPKVIGYFTLASSCLDKRLYPVTNNQKRKLPYSTVPTVVIGKLAVCKSVQGQGVGKKLLSEAIKIAYLKSRDVACMALFLKAFNDDVANFYRKRGWIEILNEPGSFVYPLAQYEAFLKGQKKKTANR